MVAYSYDTGARRQQAYLSTLIVQLERIAKIHSPRVNSVRLTSAPGQAPGWSSEGQITLNSKALPDPGSVDGLAVWLGVLMHEVGHCQWSPEMVVWEPALRKVANLVEDPREEHLVADRLPGTIDSFTQAVTTLIVGAATKGGFPGNTTLAKDVDPQASRIWPLIAGRRYLSSTLRKTVKTAAIAEKGAGWVDKVDELIADYKRLPDPGYSNHDEAEVILKTLKAMLAIDEIDIGCNAGGTSTPDVGVPIEEEEGDDGEGDNEEEGDEGSGGGGEKGNEGDETDEDAGGSGDGAGDGTGTGSSNTPIRDAAQADKEQSTDALQRQAKSILKQVRENLGVTTVDQQGGSLYPPSPEARLVEQRLMQQLKPLFDAAEAGLDHMTNQGHIRPERIAAGYRPDHVFDKWRLDQHEDVAADVVLAVDVSGSMHSHMSDLSEAIWVMRQVVSRTASKLTVLLWDDRVTEYRFPLTRQVPHLNARGSTNVTPVARLATELFEESTAKRKWFIVMTDGQSSHKPDEVQKLFGDLEHRGVAVTGLEFTHGYNDAGGYMDGWGITSTQQIKRLSQLPDLLGLMLNTVYRRIA